MKKTSSEDAMVGCLIALVSWPILAIWNGYALSVLWGWFVVTTFEARPLTIPAAIGVAAVVGYLTKQDDDYIDKDKTPTERIIQSIGMSLIRPAFALAFGWVIYQFM
jgi:hypothetical protein